MMACSTLFSLQAVANTPVSEIEAAPESIQATSPYLIESHCSMTSMPHSAEVMAGPSIAAFLSKKNAIGMRALFSLGTDRHTMITPYYRRYFSVDVTRVYIEPGLSFNFVEYPSQLMSGNLVLGFAHDITGQFFLGGQAGFEIQGDFFGSSNALYLGALNFSPKAALNLGMYF